MDRKRGASLPPMEATHFSDASVRGSRCG
ncbi:MAG: hypothetical protein RLZ97_1812, partial [Verrucomicrobiota bacterium]